MMPKVWNVSGIIHCPQTARCDKMALNLISKVIYFRTKKLAKAFNCERDFEKKYGEKAKKIRIRMAELAATENL